MCTPPSNAQDSGCSIDSPTLGIFHLLHLTILVGGKAICAVLICIFLKTDEVEPLNIYLLAIWILSMEKRLFKFPPPPFGLQKGLAFSY